MNDHTTTGALERLNDAIHTLAQPLTALSFTVEMGLLNPSPEEWKSSLQQARSEVRRAITALEDARAASQILAEDASANKEYGRLPWKQPK